jgi:hypothetical protein
LWQLLGGADPGQEDGGDDEADRVREDRVRRGDRGDQAARHARPGHLRDGDAELQLRVAFDQVIAVDELGEIRLVGDVEEDREDADDELDSE